MTHKLHKNFINDKMSENDSPKKIFMKLVAPQKAFSKVSGQADIQVT
jgi:hypothetical protein